MAIERIWPFKAKSNILQNFKQPTTRDKNVPVSADPHQFAWPALCVQHKFFTPLKIE